MTNTPHLHDAFKDQELINVKMSVRDYNTMMKIIERDRSMGVVAKYLLSIAGGIITIFSLVKLEVFPRFFS